MRERDVERALARYVKAQGGVCWKFVSPSLAGVPDRVVILPGGRIAFVEVKAPGAKPRPLQVRRMEQLRSLGMTCFVLDNPTDVKEMCNAI